MALAAASAAIASVTVHDDTDQGRPCFRVETASATYYFQKESGGFSSIVDKNGNDWISFKPDQNSGSAGEYRGLPNLGECCHPGYPDYRGEGVSMTSEAQQAAGSVTVTSRSSDNAYRTRWEFYDDRAELTVLGMGANWWFLYEGTPAGSLDRDRDRYVWSDGRGFSVTQSHEETDLPDPEWIYFYDTSLRRSLLLVSHTDDDIDDNFWEMNGDMTVFGFGRTCRGVCFGFTPAMCPRAFTIALLEDTSFAVVSDVAAAILNPTHARSPAAGNPAAPS